MDTVTRMDRKTTWLIFLIFASRTPNLTRLPPMNPIPKGNKIMMYSSEPTMATAMPVRIPPMIVMNIEIRNRNNIFVLDVLFDASMMLRCPSVLYCVFTMIPFAEKQLYFLPRAFNEYAHANSY